MEKSYPAKLIAISKEYPFPELDLCSIRDADESLDPNLFTVFLLHDRMILEATYKGSWGYIPKKIIRKSDPRYAMLRERL